MLVSLPAFRRAASCLPLLSPPGIVATKAKKTATVTAKRVVKKAPASKPVPEAVAAPTTTKRKSTTRLATAARASAKGPTAGKKLIIAEKPSVANDIARALGGFTRHGDYYENDEYVLSSAIGHLLELIAPEGVEIGRAHV